MAQLNERSIPEVFSDIACHIQEIVRSELLLAQVAIKQEGRKAIQPIVRLCLGAGLAVFLPTLRKL